MTDDRANADEGSDPSGDIKRQNPGGTTTGDITGGGDDRAGAGEGSDADDRSDGKTQEAAKAGRSDFDPNAGQE